MTDEIRFPRIYSLLKAAGHDPEEVAEILLDARRNDVIAHMWIKALRARRWRASHRRIAAA